MKGGFPPDRKEPRKNAAKFKRTPNGLHGQLGRTPIENWGEYRIPRTT